MISNKKHLEHVQALQAVVMRELQGFQIGKYAEIPEAGLIDLPIFGIRFKFVEMPKEGDDQYQIILIPNEDHLDSDKLFITLCSKGYLHWLRHSMGSSHSFMRTLQYRDRWELLLETALELARANHKGDYIIQYYEHLRSRPLLDIYHEDQTVFDWILVSTTLP